MSRTIEDLTEEVAGMLNESSAKIRLRVFSVVKDVFRRIGIDKVCKPTTEEFEVRPDKGMVGKIRIPEKMFLPLIDVRVCNISAFQKNFNQNDKSALSFFVTSQEIVFPNMQSGKVELDYMSFYLDEEGSMLIGDIEYDACFQTAMYEMLKNTRQDPLKTNVPILRADAANAVLEARGEYNKLTKNKMNTFQRDRHQKGSGGTLKPVINTEWHYRTYNS